VSGIQFAAERQLLDLARTALEREAMTIRALKMPGRVPEAHARSDRFRSRFPDSVRLPTAPTVIS
jgi:hypothetical protein